MLVGRITKQPLQVSRFTVDFSEFLDQGEGITNVTVPTIKLLGTGWSGPYAGNLPYSTPPPVIDTNPLLLVGTYVLIGTNMVQVFLKNGSIGLVYQVQYVITGASTRQLPVEVNVQVNAP